MSQLWTFSPSSEPLLQRCIQAALLQDSDNKWTRQFGRKTTKNLANSPVSDEKLSVEIVEIHSSEDEVVKIDPPVHFEAFFETLENDVRLDFVIEECSKKPDLMLKMAERLSPNIVDKLLEQIFTIDNINTHFFTSFFLVFLPNYLKHKKRISVDILIKTGERYPETHQELMKILLKDPEIPNELLNNYLSIINNEKCTMFLESLFSLEIPSENFIHKVSAIDTAYANCVKTEKTQSFIKNCLITHKHSCTNDRSYGKLFLSFLKAEKSSEHKINIKQMEDCLEIHKSPFKRPCLTLLREFETDN